MKAWPDGVRQFCRPGTGDFEAVGKILNNNLSTPAIIIVVAAYNIAKYSVEKLKNLFKYFDFSIGICY